MDELSSHNPNWTSSWHKVNAVYWGSGLICVLYGVVNLIQGAYLGTKYIDLKSEEDSTKNNVGSIIVFRVFINKVYEIS